MPKLLCNLRKSYVLGLVMFILLLAVVTIAHWLSYIEFEPRINILAITGIPLFFVTILELVKTHELQTATLVRSHISDFLSNEELNSAFHYLIYGYSDDKWRKVKSVLPQDIDRDDAASRTDENRIKVWSKLDSINVNRKLGLRFYDPDFFQGSKEEQHLDAVLHYFDVLAYNYRKDLISLADISGVSGYHLAVIGSREVVTYYLKQTKDYWAKLPYNMRVGAEPPFVSLEKLLAALKDYNMNKKGD